MDLKGLSDVILYKARACAWCTHYASFSDDHCKLDDQPIDMSRGTCGAWRLDRDVVFEFSSSHEKADAIALKTATYQESD